MKTNQQNNVKYYIPNTITDTFSQPQSQLHRTQKLKGSILFFDLVQFTNLTQSFSESGARGAEKLYELMTTYYDLMIDIVQLYGGTVYQFAGDSALAAFQEDENKKSTISAVTSCALEMKKALKEAKLQYKDHILETKFSLSYGEFQQVLLGDSDSYFQVALIGKAIDQAVRAEASAKAGEIIITREMAELLGDSAQVEEGENRFRLVDLKTKTQPDEKHKEAIIENEPAHLKKCTKFIAPTLYEKIKTGQFGYIGEFRDVTSLFVQIHGIDYSNPEQKPINQINSFYRKTRELATNFGGTLIQTDFSDKGSVFLILFGAPNAQEHKETMAVRFAARLQETLPEYKFINKLHIGISTGPLYCGDVGSTTRKGYSVLGESVNMASRLMEHASGTIAAVDEKTANTLTDTFTLTKREKIKLKGISDAKQFYTVAGENKTVAKKIDHSALVGRKKELKILKDRLEESKTKGGGIGVVGDAGVGKSRLIYDVVLEAKAANIDVYTGTCYSYEKFTPYFAWKSIWKSLFNVQEEIHSSHVFKKICDGLTFLEDDRESWAKVFARLLSETSDEDALTSKMDPKKKSETIFEITAQVIKEKTNQSQVMLLFEDYHWIDEGSDNLIRYILNQNIPGAILMVVARPEGPISELNSIKGYYELALKEFEEEDALTYLRLKMNLAVSDKDKSGAAKKLENEILHRAHGNPFFLESIVYSLKEQRVLQTTENGKSYLADTNQDIEIPGSLQEVLLSRIDRLGESEKVVLKNASVIGRLFAYNLLDQIAPKDLEGDLSTHLSALEKNDFTLLETSEPLSYLFKHVLIRDVAYNSMLTATRQTLHNQLANYLESLGKEKIDENIDHLAYHYAEAKNKEKSIKYSLIAARNAASQYANAEAIHHYTNIIQLLDEHNGDRELFYDMKIELGHVYRASGNFAEAIDIFQEPLEVLKDKMKLAKIHTGLGQVYQEQGNIDQSTIELEKALVLLGARVPQSAMAVNLAIVSQLSKRIMNTITPFLPMKASKKSEEKVIMLYTIMEYLTKIYFFANAEKMAWANLSQVNMADRLKNKEAIKGKAYASLSLIYGALGLFGRSKANAEISRQFMEKSNDPNVEAMYLQRTGTTGMYTNEPAMWYEKLTKAATLYEKLGETWETAVAVGTKSVTMQYSGDFEKGVELNYETLSHGVTEDVKQVEAWQMSTDGYFNYIVNLKDADTCIHLMEKAFDLSVAVNDNAGKMSGLRNILFIHIREERIDEVIKAAGELFEGLNQYTNIMPHLHAGYYDILLAIELAKKHGKQITSNDADLWKQCLNKIKKLGNKYPFIKCYALMSEALNFSTNGNSGKAKEKALESVRWHEKGPNQLERVLAYYQAAELIPEKKDEYIKKGIALATKNKYAHELKRFEKLRG
ncbi:MAG: adenylate/guanylate cyclase domain-containing protein [Leptospirales bacterium]